MTTRQLAALVTIELTLVLIAARTPIITTCSFATIQNHTRKPNWFHGASTMPSEQILTGRVGCRSTTTNRRFNGISTDRHLLESVLISDTSASSKKSSDPRANSLGQVARSRTRARSGEMTMSAHRQTVVFTY